jgi:hypothetical protein
MTYETMGSITHDIEKSQPKKLQSVARFDYAVFIKTKQKIGSYYRDHQYYVTAMLDMLLKVMRRC